MAIFWPNKLKCLAYVWPIVWPIVWPNILYKCLVIVWPMFGPNIELFGHVWSSVYKSKYGSKCYFSHKYEKKAEKIEGEDKEAIK